jgi:hypothetical protein
MVDIAIVGTALKTATDALKSVKDLVVGTAVKTQISQAYEEILAARETAMAAQEERFTLLERIRTLETELADLKAWGSEKEQYELKQVNPGSSAYVPKPGTEAAKSPHWLCPNCYTNGKKSFMQHQGAASPKGGPEQKYACATCKMAFITHYGVHP